MEQLAGPALASIKRTLGGAEFALSLQEGGLLALARGHADGPDLPYFVCEFVIGRLGIDEKTGLRVLYNYEWIYLTLYWYRKERDHAT